MAGIENFLNGYCSSYEIIAKDICEGIDEGFIEGLREGIKQGFVEGIKECRITGFDNIEVKDIEESLKNTIESASDESAITIIKRAVSNEYWAKISPSFKLEMEEACNKTIMEIKKSVFEVDKASSSDIEICVNAADEKVTGCISNVCEGVKKNLPTYAIFSIFFDCLQDEFNRDLGKNLKGFKEGLCKEIENKINNKW